MAMKRERVLITGCGGMLGNALYPYFESWYDHVLATDKTIDEEWLGMLDIREDDKLFELFREYKPDIVLHLAAETDLEFCETHPDKARETNENATKNIAKLSEEYGATLVYISTAGVFNGKKSEFYTEADPPNPIMIYGKTKYAGETHTLEHCSKSFVVRAGWMMGGGRRKEKKFTYKILHQIVEGRKEIFAVVDKWGTPTYTYDFAINLFLLLETRKYGLYHMVCSGKATRYDVAGEIIRLCNRHDIQLTPVHSDFFSKEYFAPRPDSEMMINRNLNTLGINHMRSWKAALYDYIKNQFPDYIDGKNASDSQTPHIPSPYNLHDNSPDSERRRATRHTSPSTVEYAVLNGQPDHYAKNLTKGIVIDISDSGFCMYVFDQLKMGKHITLNKGALPTKHKRATVQWVRHERSGVFRAGCTFS